MKKVMEESNCHIHFPDSNRNCQLEKSNQVSIAGSPVGVERARINIRNLQPLFITFQLPIIPNFSIESLNSLQKTYNLNITYKTHGNITNFIVRSSIWNIQNVKLVVNQLSGGRIMQLPVTLEMTMYPNITNYEPQYYFAQIMAITRTKIHLDNSFKYPTLFIIGYYDQIFLARQIVLNSLPIVLLFDVRNDTPFNDTEISCTTTDYNLNIIVKPKTKQCSKSVIIKGTEQNIKKLFLARRRLLMHKNNDDAEIFNNTNYNGYHENPAIVTHSNSMHYQKNSMPISNNAAINQRNAPIQVTRVTVSSKPKIEISPMINTNTKMLDTFLPNKQIQSCKDINLSSSMNSLPDMNQFKRPPPGLTKPPNSLSLGNAELKRHFMNSGINKLNTVLFSKSHNFVNSLQDAGGTSPTSCESGVELDSDECMEKTKSILEMINLKNSPMYKDYSERKQLADIAIQKFPHGEPRCPTGFFAGYGFSKSMTYPKTERKFLVNQHHDCEIMEEETDEQENTNKNLIDILMKNDLEKYVHIFVNEEIDLSTFLTLTESDLRELKIDTFGARRKTMLLIKNLKEEQHTEKSMNETITNISNHHQSNFHKIDSIPSQSLRW